MNDIEHLKARQANSPINALFRNFSASPFKIVPEREGELLRIRDDLKLRIQLDVGGSGVVFQVGFDGPNRLLKTNLITLEKLWALSYGYFVIQHMQKAAGAGVEINTPADVRVLLSWVHFTPFSVDVEWPKNTPRPDVAGSGEFINEANEVFLSVSSFVLLHEVGHHIRDEVYYGDGPGSEAYNHQIENNADSWAYKFILDRWWAYKDDNRVLMKRAYSIGMTLVILASLRMIQRKVLGTNSHPSALSRLRAYFGYLDKMHATSAMAEVESVKQNLVGVAFAILRVTLDIYGGGELEIKHEDSYACLDYIEKRYAELSQPKKKGAEAPGG